MPTLDEGEHGILVAREAQDYRPLSGQDGGFALVEGFSRWENRGQSASLRVLQFPDLRQEQIVGAGDYPMNWRCPF